MSDQKTWQEPFKKQVEVAYKWSGANSISDLAGSLVPVRHVNGDSYRVGKFDGLLSGLLPVDMVSSLVDRGVFDYWNGDWHFSVGITNAFLLFFCSFLVGLCAYVMLAGFTSLIFGVVFFLSVVFLTVYSSMKRR